MIFGKYLFLRLKIKSAGLPLGTAFALISMGSADVLSFVRLPVRQVWGEKCVKNMNGLESHRRGYRGGREGRQRGSVRRLVGSIAQRYAAFRWARRPGQAED